MNTKKVQPPARPPAPKISFRSKEVPDFAIRFNPSMADDSDEDEDLFTISNKSKIERSRAQTLPVAADNQRRPVTVDKQRRPVSIKVSESNSTKVTAETKIGNLIDEIRDKLSDPLNVLSEKFTSLSPLHSPQDSNPVTPRRLSEADALTENIKKVNSDTLHGSNPVLLNGQTSESPSQNRKQPEIQPEGASESIPQRMDSLKMEIEDLLSFSDKPSKPEVLPVKPVKKSNTIIRRDSRDDADSSFDDIFGSEPLEDFFGAANLNSVTSHVTSQSYISIPDGYEDTSTIHTVQQSPIRREYVSDVKPVAMTMSSLLSRNQTPDDEKPLIDLSENSHLLTAELHRTPNNDTTLKPSPSLSSIHQFKIIEPDYDDSKASSTDGVTEAKTPSAIDPITTAIKHKLTDLPHFPYKRVVLSSLFMFVYLIIPWPPYIAGFILGSFMASMTIAFYLWLMKEPSYKEPFQNFVPPLDELPPIPDIKENRNIDGIFRGWMNELQFYDPEDYHINQTNSVYLTLENTTLRLQRPRNNIPKRAMWDETTHNPKFIHQRYYDLSGCNVTLLPGGLVKKRVWSKKYPICVTVNQQKYNVEKVPLSHQNSVSSEENDGFEIVSKESCDEVILYLFTRTNRQKEEWYRRFAAAAKGTPLVHRLPDILNMKRSVSADFKMRRPNSSDSLLTLSSSESVGSDLLPHTDPHIQTLQDYAHAMGRVIPAELSGRSRSKSIIHREVLRTPSTGAHISCEPQLYWFNALLTRSFWDFIRDKHWADVVSEKIQKKLSKIRVPYFINELTITDIELGVEMPVVRRASQPYLDERGLWFDADIAYNGGFRMTLETKVNLMKFKQGKIASKNQKLHKLRSAVTHSDEEDSVESSSDSDAENTIPSSSNQDESAQQGGKAQKKFMRIVNKITKSQYFQKATEIKYIKKAMEEVSNTPIKMSVEVHSLVGVLTVNIPPPPTDRLWYGFRSNPRLWLSARPKVGERAVTVTHITEWIEKKLSQEFQKVFVLPNMDDLVLPIMNAGKVENEPS